MAYGRKRVLFLSDFHPYDRSVFITGSILQVYNIAKNLSKSECFDVHLVVSTNDRKKSGKILREGGITVHYIKNPRFEILKIPIYACKLGEIKPDIVFQRGRGALTFVGALSKILLSSKFIWSSNALEGLSFFKYSRQAKKKPYLLLYGLILDILIHAGIVISDVIVAQDERQLNIAKKRFWWKNVYMCHNVQERPEASTDKSEQPTVSWVGRITEGKNPEIFIKLAEEMPGYKFVMAGIGKPTLLPERLPQNLEFVGCVPREEVLNILKKSWVLVITSKSEVEGIPNVVIESMLVETPVLSLARIESLEKFGLVCEDYKTLKEKLKNLLGRLDKIKDLGKDMRKFAEKNFIEISSKCWEEVFYRTKTF